MKNYVAYLIVGFLMVAFFISCEDESPAEEEFASEKICFDESAPPRNTDKVTIQQGIWGDVWFWRGDFMAGAIGEICQAKRYVLIYELTTTNDVEQIGTPSGAFYSDINTTLVKKVPSDENGFFQVELEPGVYSLFVEEYGNFYSNRFSLIGIFPVSVENDKVSEVRFDIKYEATL